MITKNNNGITAICIDLDGTLIDTLPALYQVYMKFLNHFGKTGTLEEFRSLVGPSIDEIVEILSKKYDLKEPAHDLSIYYVSLLMMQGFEGTELFPGVKETLESFKQQGIKLALVTSATRSLVKSCIDPLGIESQFDEIVTADDVKQAKPHPDIYRTALTKLSVAAEEAIAIEDSEQGKRAALDAGLRVIFFTHGVKELEKQEEKVTYLNNWQEIGRWIQQK
jgi:beta-phosphoglucomutase